LLAAGGVIASSLRSIERSSEDSIEADVGLATGMAGREEETGLSWETPTAGERPEPIGCGADGTEAEAAGGGLDIGAAPRIPARADRIDRSKDTGAAGVGDDTETSGCATWSEEMSPGGLTSTVELEKGVKALSSAPLETSMLGASVQDEVT
jgi:hypothetical protein